MYRLCLSILLLISAGQAADDSHAILARVRQLVAGQLARAANYSCVQTIERLYFVPDVALSRGCGTVPPPGSRTLLMSDRLRLDLAVSEGVEIYSWHGATRFVSSDVSDLIHTGPISSGNFTGFLRNIFLNPGTEFSYVGEETRDAAKHHTFKYVVALPHSSYHVQAKGGRPIIAYHGSFSVDAISDQLTSLEIIGDKPPPESPICSLSTKITYQLVTVSGRPSLVPAKFVLQLDDETHLHTVSSSEYSQCREFGGESTLHYDFSDSAAFTASKPGQEEWLPAGIPLHISLRTPLDDRTVYVGDRVQGVLLRAVKVPGSATVIPKGAILDGYLTMLENHHLPFNFALFAIKFNRLSFDGGSFRLNAWPRTSWDDRDLLRLAYGSPLPAAIAEEDHRGLFTSRGSHFQFDHFAGQWITNAQTTSSAE